MTTSTAEPLTVTEESLDIEPCCELQSGTCDRRATWIGRLRHDECGYSLLICDMHLKEWYFFTRIIGGLVICRRCLTYCQPDALTWIRL